MGAIGDEALTVIYLYSKTEEEEKKAAQWWLAQE